MPGYSVTRHWKCVLEYVQVWLVSGEVCPALWSRTWASSSTADIPAAGLFMTPYIAACSSEFMLTDLSCVKTGWSAPRLPGKTLLVIGVRGALGDFHTSTGHLCPGEGAASVATTAPALSGPGERLKHSRTLLSRPPSFPPRAAFDWHPASPIQRLPLPD